MRRRWRVIWGGFLCLFLSVSGILIGRHALLKTLCRHWMNQMHVPGMSMALVDGETISWTWPRGG